MTGITIENLSTGYDKADVLLDLSLTVKPGTITCLLGSNGAGKTTVIRSILGLTPPRRGTIRLGDTDITGMATHKVIAQGLACIPEGRRMFPKLTVEENLRLGAYQVSDEALIRARMETVFETFPRLAERRDQLAGTMSGGEQAMVSIGRGLMSGPKILLIDEPSLGLSPLYVKENFKIIDGIRDQGVTVFLVEQNVRQTLGIADYGYVLSGGRLIAEGTAEALKASPEVHAAYFG
ncbi:ABC transporter ATP-binding protein [Roseospira marina]|uniref:ABC transporter ATP-binding protein n=1 Tax=Roseospira marina TaxID=140057 RepID=A0A5M6IAM2_9PROT|nr:ABC transporter ATP-binding protein [Roseospira marina]KAA5605321.1 ABC transporter ATP-binding protein [Roseospira marina]MBB4314792.1 branched-chain amino acid transport system ATP-binding protein [Roseospira marina]MBB5087781.1 branched-chain amino acid transport system ATP-binding protein [Roseospira marina]